MPNVEPSSVLYALLLDPGSCLGAHITLFELVEPEEEKKKEAGLGSSVSTIIVSLPCIGILCRHRSRFAFSATRYIG